MAKLQAIRDLLDVVRHVRDPRELLRAAVPRLQQKRVLNRDATKTVVQTLDDDASLALVGGLRRHMLALQAAALHGGTVDYRALGTGDGATALQSAAAALSGVCPNDLEGPKRLAFWVNLYNVLSIHGVLALGIRKSVMEVPSFFSVVRYRIGGTEISLDDIEHGVLRRNARNPLTGRRPFSDPNDPRLSWVVEHLDARIHAALVCSSRSCPPIAIYEAESLGDQLDRAMRGFVAAETEANDRLRRIETSAIFRYYREDFGGSDEAIVAALCRYAEPELAARLRRAWSAGWGLWFRRYDWSLNGLGA